MLWAVETTFCAVLWAVETTFCAVEVTVCTGLGDGVGAGELELAGAAGALGAGTPVLEPCELEPEELGVEDEPEPWLEDDGGELCVGAGVEGAAGVDPECDEPVSVVEPVVLPGVWVVGVVDDEADPNREFGVAALAPEGPRPAARARATCTWPEVSGATRRRETWCTAARGVCAAFAIARGVGEPELTSPSASSAIAAATAAVPMTAAGRPTLRRTASASQSSEKRGGLGGGAAFSVSSGSGSHEGAAGVTGSVARSSAGELWAARGTQPASSSWGPASAAVKVSDGIQRGSAGGVGGAGAEAGAGAETGASAVRWSARGSTSAAPVDALGRSSGAHLSSTRRAAAPASSSARLWSCSRDTRRRATSNKRAAARFLSP